MAMQTLAAASHAMKAAADPTRLRLLALLRHGELTVGEICKVLGQSQPRVSRHLRLLAEAGYLDRFREQQCVYYRMPVAAPVDWLPPLLATLDAGESALQRDRQRVQQVIAARGRAAERQWPESRAIAEAPAELAAAIHQEIGPVGLGDTLDIGTGSGRMLELVARRAPHAVGLDISTLALRLARARLHGLGLRHCEFQRGDMYDLPCEAGSFDTVTMDRVLASAERPVAVLTEASRALRVNGRVIVVEDYDRFAARRDDPLQRMREWFSGTGLRLERFRPCDVPGGHYLVATARREGV